MIEATTYLTKQAYQELEAIDSEFAEDYIQNAGLMKDGKYKSFYEIQFVVPDELYQGAGTPAINADYLMRFSKRFQTYYNAKLEARGQTIQDKAPDIQQFYTAITNINHKIEYFEIAYAGVENFKEAPVEQYLSHLGYSDDHQVYWSDLDKDEKKTYESPFLRMYFTNNTFDQAKQIKSDLENAVFIPSKKIKRSDVGIIQDCIYRHGFQNTFVIDRIKYKDHGEFTIYLRGMIPGTQLTDPKNIDFIDELQTILKHLKYENHILYEGLVPLKEPLGKARPTEAFQPFEISGYYDADAWQQDDVYTLSVDRQYPNNATSPLVVTIDMDPRNFDLIYIAANPIEEEWQRGRIKIYLNDDGLIDKTTFTYAKGSDSNTDMLVALGYSEPVAVNNPLEINISEFENHNHTNTPEIIFGENSGSGTYYNIKWIQETDFYKLISDVLGDAYQQSFDDLNPEERNINQYGLLMQLQVNVETLLSKEKLKIHNGPYG